MATDPSITEYLINSIRHNKASINNKTQNETKYPCGICNNEVKHNEKAIFCDECTKWAHIRCTNITSEEYREIQLQNKDNPDLINEKWLCIKCTMYNRSEYIPFIFQSCNQITNMNSLDTMKLVDMLPNDNVFSEALNINTKCCNEDLDENSVQNINCKYYPCSEFFNQDNTKDFNILHSNVNGYISHSENINQFLANCTKTTFDTICITETSLNKDKILPINSLPLDYDYVCTPTLGTKGGTMILINKIHDFYQRDDLNIQTKEIESVWIEINKPKKKNIVIGCLYRHPHFNNLDDFFLYINSTLTKLSKEKKDIYLAGDFNLDLMKYNTNTKSRDFNNIITSYGYLPLITQPTRISNTTSTLIDNIFTNAFTLDNESGNILIEFADHLTQFVSIKKEIYPTKKKPEYKLDNSKFDENLFLDDLSIQNFTNSDNANERFSDLLWKYESCVKRHMPLKKLNKKEIKKKQKPWITKEILIKINHRNNLFSRKKKNQKIITLT